MKKEWSKAEHFSLLRTTIPHSLSVRLSTVCGLLGASGWTKRRQDHSVPRGGFPCSHWSAANSFVLALTVKQRISRMKYCRHNHKDKNALI